MNINIPPDNKWYANLVKEIEESAKKYTDTMIINENLLDNGYFVDPINQRGQIEYTRILSEDPAYFIDRWVYGKGINNIIINNGISLSQYDTSYCYIAQKLSTNTLSLLQKRTVTISALVKGKCVVSLGTINNGERFSVDDDDKYTLCSRTFKWDTDNLNPSYYQNMPYIGIVSAESLLTILAAKLEFGSVQTLAHKEGEEWVLNVPAPNKALELAQCQRYQFKVLSNDNLYGGAIGFGLIISSTTARITIPTPVTMDKTPNITFLSGLTASDFIIFSNSGSTKVTDILSTGETFVMQNGIIMLVHGIFTDINCPCVLKINKAGNILLDANQ